MISYKNDLSIEKSQFSSENNKYFKLAFSDRRNNSRYRCCFDVNFCRLPYVYMVQKRNFLQENFLILKIFRLISKKWLINENLKKAVVVRTASGVAAMGAVLIQVCGFNFSFTWKLALSHLRKFIVEKNCYKSCAYGKDINRKKLRQKAYDESFTKNWLPVPDSTSAAGKARAKQFSFWCLIKIWSYNHLIKKIINSKWNFTV